jgi:hypothetical protein
MGMVDVQLLGARFLVATATEPPAKVNEFANRRGEILAEFIQCCVPPYGQRVFFFSTLY